VINSGVLPAAARLPMTVEEVDAGYDADQEQDDAIAARCPGPWRCR
jgi:hypothetical protein